MDNLTHSLIGISVGEAAYRVYEKNALQNNKTEYKPNHVLRGAFWFASWAGNNFPDLDVLYQRITPGKLGALLHHRGHTHTLLMALPQALLIALLYWIFHRKTKFDLKEKIWFFALAFFGIFTHIFADSWNSYGVHPFWPFNNHWYYGDFIFIVEPWLWMFLLPFIFSACDPNTRAGKFGRFIISFLFLAAIGLLLNVAYVPMNAAFTLIGAGILSFVYHLRSKKSLLHRSFVSVSLCALVLSFFLVEKKHVHSYFAQDARVKDAILSPLPGNPFCWSVLTVNVEEQDYVLRKGYATAFPKFLTAQDCQIKTAPSETTAKTSKPSALSSNEIFWMSEFRAPLKQFQQLAFNCQAHGFLQFSRAPFWGEYEAATGEKFAMIGDFRFDREKGLGFGEMLLDENGCPAHLPPWGLPRTDLITKTAN